MTAVASALCIPSLASAHEVYVLSHDQVQQGLSTPPFNMTAVLVHNFESFLFWTFIATVVVVVVFSVSVTRRLEILCSGLFERLRPYAAPVARITIGISFLASAYYQATYGPEFGIAATYGNWTSAVTALLLLAGAMLIAGVYVRVAALLALALFITAVYEHGFYMLTYTNYLGEIILLLILGVHHGVSRRVHAPSLFAPLAHTVRRIAAWLAPYSFLVLRVCFGISLLFSSLYAKIIHNNLALAVAETRFSGHSVSLAEGFGFEPHFLVLGAAVVEIVLALFFIFGIEIRFTALFLEFWLALSLWWFGEAVWPHLILIGIPIALFCWGYDKYSVEGRLFKKGSREPVF